MSLRKIAKILGISPTYLSLLLNGKRPWRGNLKERYEEFVNTFVNSPHESGYKITGAQEGIRTPTPDKGKRILSPVLSVRPCVLQSTPFL
jgi:transcriptional regulator with XRE-family HTH domain